MGVRMGVDLSAVAPGVVEVVESPRRLRRETSYGYVHALWWIWLEDGRSAASVPPGAGEPVRSILAQATGRDHVFDAKLTEQLRLTCDEALGAAGRGPTDRAFQDLMFACNASLLRRHACGECARLTDTSVPAASGLKLPTHCFPDGIAYAVVQEGKAVSIAFAHRTGTMEDAVADLGVETAEGHRRRGYAKTAVSRVAGHVIDRGGEARYGCAPENHASVATALSVGFEPYGVSLILSAAATPEELSA